MKKYSLLFWSLLALQGVWAQSKVHFSGQSLDKEQLHVPSARSEFTLVGLAFSAAAEESLGTWLEPAYNKFILKNGLFDSELDVTPVFVPVFSGPAKALKNKTISRISQSITNELKPYLLVVEEEAGLKSLREDADKKEPVFLLLNKRGEVIWRGEGSFKQDYFDQIEAVVFK